jgi:mannose-6-phosphate isomerase
MIAYPLFFRPVFQTRIWGGTRLQAWYDECPQQDGIGEAWILSDHPDGPTKVVNGAYEGKTLSAVMTAEPTWFDGLKPPFPLLFKVIDAAADLSVQVHPNDEYGLKHAGEQGKTECWWVLDADNTSRIVYGHHAPTREAFEDALQHGSWDTLLQYEATKPGDFWFVPSGKLHALGAGTMVLEVQQSSNTTYRVYDYDRVDKDGHKRELHLTDALNVTTYPDETSTPPVQDSDGRGTVLANCPYFRVERWLSSDVAERNTTQVHVVTVADGSGTLVDSATDATYDMTHGDIVLLPRGASVSFEGEATLIATTVPTRGQGQS